MLVVKNHFLLVAEVARWKKITRYSLQRSLVTRCKGPLLIRSKICSWLVAEVGCCKKSLVTRCKIRSLLIVEITQCKNSLDTHCRSCSLQKSLVTRRKIGLLQNMKKMFSQQQTYCKSNTYVQIFCNRDHFDLKDLFLCCRDLHMKSTSEGFCSFICNNKWIY